MNPRLLVILDADITVVDFSEIMGSSITFGVHQFWRHTFLKVRAWWKRRKLPVDRWTNEIVIIPGHDQAF